MSDQSCVYSAVISILQFRYDDVQTQYLYTIFSGVSAFDVLAYMLSVSRQNRFISIVVAAIRIFDDMYIPDIAARTVILKCEMCHFFIKFKVHFDPRGFWRRYITLRNAGFLDSVQHKVQQSFIRKKVYSACDLTSAAVCIEPPTSFNIWKQQLIPRMQSVMASQSSQQKQRISISSKGKTQNCDESKSETQGFPLNLVVVMKSCNEVIIIQ